MLGKLLEAVYPRGNAFGKISAITLTTKLSHMIDSLGIHSDDASTALAKRLAEQFEESEFCMLIPDVSLFAYKLMKREFVNAKQFLYTFLGKVKSDDFRLTFLIYNLQHFVKWDSEFIVHLIERYYSAGSSSQQKLVDDFVSLYRILLGFDKLIADEHHRMSLKSKIVSLTKRGLVFASTVALSLLRAFFIPI